MWEDTVNKGLRISDFPWLAQFRGVISVVCIIRGTADSQICDRHRGKGVRNLIAGKAVFHSDGGGDA